MARRTTAKSTSEVTTAVNDAAVVSNVVEDIEKKKVETTTQRTSDVEGLFDGDEIEVVSLIPNVSYKDSYTNDLYEWAEVGHVEILTFETLKNMWKSYKGYFRNLYLKPLDDRVIKRFGLTNTYNSYEYLMDGSNYTKANIDVICENISKTPILLKLSVCNKIKDLVITGSLNDIKVIRTLERRLGLDLISFLD